MIENPDEDSLNGMDQKRTRVDTQDSFLNGESTTQCFYNEENSELIGLYQVMKIREWLPEKFNEKPWKLLYRGTRDGFKQAQLKQRSQGISPTITLIRARSGNVFGGFLSTPRMFDDSGYKADAIAFLFSVTFEEKYEIKTRKNAFFEWPGLLIDFGGGGDIQIYEDCNIIGNNYTKFPNHYSCPKFQSFEHGKTYLAGSEKFFVDEIEVFEVVSA